MTLDKVHEFIVRQRLIVPGDRVVAACSGGPDSLAMVDILRQLRLELKFELAVAHVDHMLRGTQSAADAQFVADYCQEQQLVCHVTAINVAAHLTGSVSRQAVARTLRYEYLRAVARAWGGAKIATAHQRDDQAETVLMHLLRGAGSAGLRGIMPQSADLIRPLLDLNRRDVEQYCYQHQLNPRQDLSNQQPTYLRNRLRLRVIPYIEQELAVPICDQLCRTAQIMADEYDVLKQLVQSVWPNIVEEGDAALEIYIAPLLEQPVALQRLILRQALLKSRGQLTGICFTHVEKMIVMASEQTVGTRLDLPGGWLVERTYTTLRLGAKIQQVLPPAIDKVGLNVPGATIIKALGIKITAELQPSGPVVSGDELTALFDFSKLKLPLMVRTRRAGDRFWPLGLQGTKVVKKFLIDCKLPQQSRQQIPLICDQQGQILWLGGLRRSGHAPVDSLTNQILILKISSI